jgi:hypothetical protein
VSYSKLRGRKNGKTSLSDRPTTNNALNLNQENALISWIEVLNSCYTPPCAKDIESAANRLLKIAGSERVVGLMYSYRFIDRLPLYIKLVTQKPKETYELKPRILKLLAIGMIGLLISIVSMISNLMRSIIGMKLASKMAKDLTNTLSLRVKLLALLLEIEVKLLPALNASPLMAG